MSDLLALFGEVSFDLGCLHPALAGADGVRLALLAWVSWAGGMFITDGECSLW